MLRHTLTRRVTAALLIALGAVLMLLATEVWMGMLLLLAGVALELAGIALERRKD